MQTRKQGQAANITSRNKIMISGTLLLFIVTILLGIYWFRRNRWKNSPPGPPRLPLIGNLHQLDIVQHKAFGKWADTYGPIFRVDFPNIKHVVISDYKLVKEIFSEVVFSGRQDFTKFDVIGDRTAYGIINTEGSHWEELRRFTLRQLREFGFGKNSMEHMIMDEVTGLIEQLKDQKNKPISDIKDRLLFAVVNSLWAIVTGERHSKANADLAELTKHQQKTKRVMSEKGALVLVIPSIMDWAPGWSGYGAFAKSMQAFGEYFKNPIQKHKQSYSDDHTRDFIDVYLKHVKENKDPKSAFYGETGDKNLRGILSDFYFAGTDSTATTLSWMTLYLSKLPEIQAKLQKEIKDITQNSRPVSVSDRPSMPFAEAVIAETLRLSSIVPIGVSHRALADSTFKGYDIPKDTLITPLLHYIHNDPKIWGDPEVFRPERFLLEDGAKFKKHEALLPFSIGRRQCLGETLARDSLFLFATNIFQRFNIVLDESGDDYGFEPENNFMLEPKPFSVYFNERLE